MKTRTCEQCGEHLRARHSHRARFCSTRCRVAAHRARHAETALPKELTARRRWVRRDERKAPRRLDGGFASVTDASSWSTYTKAEASPVGVGLGYVLTAGDGVVCIDLDHCLTDGELAPWARRILDQCPPTFIEVSQSGDGLHVFGHGRLEGGRRIRQDGECIEVYSDGRYIAVTGDRFEGAPAELVDLSEVIASVS